MKTKLIKMREESLLKKDKLRHPETYKVFNPFLFLMHNRRIHIRPENITSLFISLREDLKKEEETKFHDHSSSGQDWIPNAIPYKRADIHQICASWKQEARKNSSAIKIQACYKMHYLRRKFIMKIFERYVNEVTPAAVLLQKNWRVAKAKTNLKYYAMKMCILKEVKSKARVISENFKSYLFALNNKYSLLITQLREGVYVTSSKIKSLFKGSRTRNLYKLVREYERTYKSIKWIGSGKEVYLIGSMTDPPWISKLEMDYCPLRNVFVKYFANIDMNSIEFAFIVDGENKISPIYSRKVNRLGVETNNMSPPKRSQKNYDFPRSFSKEYLSDSSEKKKLRLTSSLSNIDAYKNQPIFQGRESCESSGEVEVINALAQMKSPAAQSPKTSNIKLHECEVSAGHSVESKKTHREGELIKIIDAEYDDYLCLEPQHNFNEQPNTINLPNDNNMEKEGKVQTNIGFP